MDAIEIRAWNRFENKVLNLFQCPEEYVTKSGFDFQALVCRLRIWNSPTFAEYSSYLLFESRHHLAKPDYLLVAINWNRPEDLRKFSSPIEGVKFRLDSSVQPTITYRHVLLEADVVLNILRSLQGLTCVPFPSWENLSIDGIISGVEVQSNWQKTSFSWINEGPAQWRELIESVEKIHQRFHNIFGDRDSN